MAVGFSTEQTQYNRLNLRSGPTLPPRSWRTGDKLLSNLSRTARERKGLISGYNRLNLIRRKGPHSIPTNVDDWGSGNFMLLSNFIRFIRAAGVCEMGGLRCAKYCGCESVGLQEYSRRATPTIIWLSDPSNRKRGESELFFLFLWKGPFLTPPRPRTNIAHDKWLVRLVLF